MHSITKQILSKEQASTNVSSFLQPTDYVTLKGMENSTAIQTEQRINISSTVLTLYE